VGTIFGIKIQGLFKDSSVCFPYLFQQCFTNLPHQKQGHQNKFKSGGNNNLQAKQAEKKFELLYAELSH